jgi:hypothetical protein
MSKYVREHVKNVFVRSASHAHTIETAEPFVGVQVAQDC